MGLLKTLKPSWWFTAQLHVKFDAGVKYGTQGQQEKGREEVDNPDEITIESDEEEKAERCAVNPPAPLPFLSKLMSARLQA